MTCVIRKSAFVPMWKVDPELYSQVRDLPIRDGLKIWCKKYPQDIPPHGEQWNWLREERRKRAMIKFKPKAPIKRPSPQPKKGKRR